MHHLVVLYGVGGLSDVGRHAIQAALERADVERITILTKHPELLDESNWKCGCPEPHNKFTEQDRKRMKLVTVTNWNDVDAQHFQDATAVVSCLGNRQPFLGHWESNEGNQVVIRNNVKRAVVCSSVGVEEDWPPMESFKPGQYILSFLFLTFGRSSFRDLTLMERAYKASDIDYLFVRPVGIGEDVKPVNRWVLQTKKYEHHMEPNMAKLDVARYVVQEAIEPTRHRSAVVIGPEPPTEEATGQELQRCNLQIELEALLLKSWLLT